MNFLKGYFDEKFKEGFLSLYALTVSFGAMFLNKFGFRNALRVSLLLGALWYVIIYFVDKGNYFYLTPVLVIVLVLFRIFHWVPYHTDFAKFSNDGDRAKQLSFFDIVFAIGVVLYLLAGLFFLKIPKTKERFDWGYRESWQELLSVKNRSGFFAFMADGAEAMVGLVVWPIFMFQLLGGNYFEVGYVSALIILGTMVLQFILGGKLDRGGNREKKRALKMGTLLYSLGWVIKIFVLTAFHIFVVGVYHNVMKIFARTSFDTMFYDIVASKRHYVDEFTVLHEMAVHLGKALSGVIIIIMASFLPLQWVFLLGALASVIMTLLRKDYSYNQI